MKHELRGDTKINSGSFFPPFLYVYLCPAELDSATKNSEWQISIYYVPALTDSIRHKLYIQL